MMDPMLASFGRGSFGRGTLLLADISGYTNFLNAVAEAHRALIIEADEPPAAYAVVASLLDAILAALEPAFRLAKFEGDALFAVEAEGLAHGAAMLDSVRACYKAFQVHLDSARMQWTCTCNSCIRLPTLDLKFVVHHGDYVAHRIANQEELAGPDVIVAHRLLKNHARDLVGARPYALFTDAALEALAIPAAGMSAASEAYDNMPPVAVHVLTLA